MAENAPTQEAHRGPRPRRAASSRRALRALACALLAFVLEILLVLPFVDELSERSFAVHVTQHGLIFLGGVLMGAALWSLYDLSRAQTRIA